MFNQKFKTEHQFETGFFEAALTLGHSKLGHAFMLTGSDPVSQYYLAIQVAKYLNCVTKEDNCDCINCSWIKNNRHPAVITISPIDYLQGNKDSKATTVISVYQSRYLRKELANSSQYHRVIIFTDAVAGSEYEGKNNLFKEYEDFTSPHTEKNEEERVWLPLPLTYKVFQSEAANTLLKTLEEPGSNVTFFFLTKDKEDMLDTIVSRCQIIPVTAKISDKFEESHMIDFLDKFPPSDYASALSFSEKLMEISKLENLNFGELLDSIQRQISVLIRANIDDRNLTERLISYSEKIEKARQELVNYVNPQAVLDSLFLSMT